MTTYLQHLTVGRRCKESGATSVEFALIAAIFLPLLFGAIELGRVLWLWNAAGEATRLGARLAVVCDVTDQAGIKSRMRDFLPILSADGANVSITQLPSGCVALPATAGDVACDTVTVTLSNLDVQTFIPFASFTPTLPPMTTTLPRESMQGWTAVSNSVCPH